MMNIRQKEKGRELFLCPKQHMRQFANLAKRIIKQVEDEAKEFDAYIFKTHIPKNIKLAEAPGKSMPIILYDPQCKGAESFNKFTVEFIQRIGV